jgi:hypothetical protein
MSFVEQQQHYLVQHSRRCQLPPAWITSLNVRYAIFPIFFNQFIAFFLLNRTLINTLAPLVTQYFIYSKPIYLAVISSYTVPPAIITFPDTRYEARSAYISVQAQGASTHTAVASNLAYLAELAWDAGFDFIFFRGVDYLKVSTISDGLHSNISINSLLICSNLPLNPSYFRLC